MPAAKASATDAAVTPADGAGAADAAPMTVAPAAPAALSLVTSGLAKLLARESEAALMSRDEVKASILPTLSQRVQELLVVLPAGVAAVDPASHLGAALAALSTTLN